MSVLDRFRLDGKTALVTGAASGLGAAIAIALAEAGATVACHGNRRPAEETAAQIVAAGGKAKSFSADLSAADGAGLLFDDVSVAMGAPHILVNNAGTIHREPAEEYSLEAWMQVLQVNEWAGRNVQVNAIAPGYFSTANTEALRADELRNRSILDRIPAGRWGNPEDLAGAAVFLASPASDYITGEILTVDGGWMAR